MGLLSLYIPNDSEDDEVESLENLSPVADENDVPTTPARGEYLKRHVEPYRASQGLLWVGSTTDSPPKSNTKVKTKGILRLV